MTNGLSAEQIGALMGGLNPGRVSSRKAPGGGPQLAYLEAWDVKATLIRVFGFANFSADAIDCKTEILDREKRQKDGKTFERVSALAQVRMRLTIHSTGATYTEVAASSQAGSQGAGEVVDFAIKTAESDALKRCAINLGTQFGLSLYQNGATADVVRVLLEPTQKAMLEEIRAPKESADIGAEDQ